ncbi:MAG: LysM peptidoglycan-binding domain-containing protein [Gammaproteobacteria bacterium]
MSLEHTKAGEAGEALAFKQNQLDKIVDRASPYLHHIVQEVERRDMPAEIALLPIIESGFRPEAYSPGHAAGVWQLIPSTGRRLGLKQNSWYDGRRDVLASTDAALDYLQLLHEHFDGDWEHALAAYNCGEGAVDGAIKRNRLAGRPTDYWALDLPAETERFVPKLLAVSKIVAHPKENRVKLKPISDQPYLKVVDVDRQIDLERAAHLANMSVVELRRLNPGLIGSATDPAGPHRLALPVSRVDAFKRRFAALPAEMALAQASSTAAEPAQREVAGEAAATKAAGRHRVQAGDSLWDIARANQVTVAQILAANRALAEEKLLRLGQVLSIPGPGAKRVAAQASRAEPTRRHRIRSGDSLWSVARRYGVSIKDLRHWNGLDNTKTALKPGAVLLVYTTPQSV